MTSLSRSLLAALLVILFIAGCDTREDPNLLNPPLPDSTFVRVINLISDGQVDASLSGFPLTAALGSFRSSPFQRFYFTTPVNLFLSRTTRHDTLLNQSLNKSGRLSYFVLGTSDTTLILPTLTGKQEETDLAQRNVAKLFFINAIADSASYFVRKGCLSGDTLFNPMLFGLMTSMEVAPGNLSLYLFSNRDSTVATTAHLNLMLGTVTYLIAARNNGQRKFYLLSSSENDPSGALQEAQPETQINATVELLNAVADAVPISVSMDRTAPIATNLAPLDISPTTTVQACSNPRGDSLAIIASGSDTLLAPIRLSVGSRTLVVVYGRQNTPKALILNRDVPSPAAGKIYLRGVNVSAVAPQASIAVGAGAPSGVSEGFRPFGTLATGSQSGYVELSEGDYPLILRNASTGEFLMAGVEHLASGSYTVFIVDHSGSPEMRFLRDDQPTTSLASVSGAGSLVTLFNMMPDMAATFTIGSLQLPSLAYSYTNSTVLPANVTTITSNAGQTTVDPSTGGYIIGATGSGGGRQLIAFKSPIAAPPDAQATIRFLNAVPDAPMLNVYIGSTDVPPIAASFGVPTQQFPQEERRYSFIITRPNDTTTVARLDAVELLKQHSYILVIGPKRDGDFVTTTAYGTLLLQE